MSKFIADFHIHSKYSRATSKLLTPEHLEYWAKIKGIQVVGTGDCIHPGWLEELEDKLQPAENGLYTLRKEYQLAETKELSNILQAKPVYFMPTTEISNIYKKGDKTRKVHNICVLPDFETVKVFQEKIERIGNIRSDGRPILGLDSKILLEMLLESGDNTWLIPAHIWTPWFSVLGSKSGFDNIEECYEDLSSEIFALETGLSSDPPMNRICSFLDKYRLVSNSDAHSPDKLGREANIFDTEIGYDNIYNSLKKDEGFVGTIEFFPEEGKYHNDGHRNCNIHWNPLETVQNNDHCTVCGNEVTKGVMYRVSELADRSNPEDAKSKQTFQSITPLPNLIAEIDQKKNPRSKGVTAKYFEMINTIGSEFEILLNTPINTIKQKSNDAIAEGIHRLRNGLVKAEGGFDGEFGAVSVFTQQELNNYKTNLLFKEDITNKQNTTYSSLTFDIERFQQQKKNIKQKTQLHGTATKQYWLTAEKEEAINHFDGPCMLIAGPGAGKTEIITKRIPWLISKGVNEKNILAITFSNNAVKEIRERIGKKTKSTISTFHKLGLEILRKELNINEQEKYFSIIDATQQKSIVMDILDCTELVAEELVKQIEQTKQAFYDDSIEAPTLLKQYNQALREINAVDLNDLIYLPLKLFVGNPDILKKYQNKYQWILVDEFQDINAAQYQLLQLISDKQNIFVAGDPDQAIFSSRGTNPQFINNFINDHPRAKLMKMNKSHRCSDIVLENASFAIKKKDRSISDKRGSSLTIKEFATDKAEANWIATGIEKLSKEANAQDIAILCRTKELFPIIGKSLNDNRIPFQIVNTQSLLLESPLKDIVEQLQTAYFGLTSNMAENKKKDIVSMFERGMKIAFIARSLISEHNLNSEQQKQLEKLTTKYDSNYSKFFDELALRIGNDDYDSNLECVSLITMHAAKGLEFEHVFIPGCESKLMPFQLFKKRSKEEISEEERLLYVAMTRAKKNLLLSYTSRRKLANKSYKGTLSPIIKRIPESLLKREKIELDINDNSDQLSLF